MKKSVFFMREICREERSLRAAMKITSLAILAIIGGFGLIIAGCGEEEGPIQPPPPAPPEYADKHMPAGWWADEKIIAEGKEIFEGVKNIDVNCSSCHGKDGKPVKAGARDFRKTERMKLYPDSVWFWRISEGVPNTKMKSWKSKLPEEDRWKAMAYEPIFVVVSEILGGKIQDARYERLAKEVTKVTVILYSMTALTGGLFIFVLLATYPQLTAWLIGHFFAVFAVMYPLLFIFETIVLYLYWYTWDAWQGPKKLRHIALGVLLNIIGLATLIVIDGPTAVMNTPAKFAEGGMDLKTFIDPSATLWDKMNNYTWWPLNLHRTVGNVVFGGFITGPHGAYLYFAAQDDEERAFYDWFGFVGNLIGVGALLALPFAGYLLAFELCDYDASICPYMMADQLSMFFEMQGAMVGLIFLASNYYIWLSMKRIEGLEQIRMRTT